MKTILVAYSNQRTPLTDKQIRELKLYAFNSESELEEGDIITSEAYDTPMHVVSVMDKSHKYYNKATGDLSDNMTSTNQRPIVTLEIRDNNNEVVYGSVSKPYKPKQ